MRRSTSDPTPLPPVEALRDKFVYEPDSGRLVYLTQSRGLGRVREEAGCVAKTGHRLVGFQMKLYKVSRIIWLMVTGKDPGKALVDHINGNPSDNRWDNLRLADYSENGQNRKVGINNSSGHKNVTLTKRGKYRVSLCHKGVKLTSDFLTLTEAVAYADQLRAKVFESFARNS